jgi:hypothetical protein
MKHLVKVGFGIGLLLCTNIADADVFVPKVSSPFEQEIYNAVYNELSLSHYVWEVQTPMISCMGKTCNNNLKSLSNELRIEIEVQPQGMYYQVNIMIIDKVGKIASQKKIYGTTVEEIAYKAANVTPTMIRVVQRNSKNSNLSTASSSHLSKNLFDKTLSKKKKEDRKEKDASNVEKNQKTSKKSTDKAQKSPVRNKTSKQNKQNRKSETSTGKFSLRIGTGLQDGNTNQFLKNQLLINDILDEIFLVANTVEQNFMNTPPLQPLANIGFQYDLLSPLSLEIVGGLQKSNLTHTMVIDNVINGEQRKRRTSSYTSFEGYMHSSLNLHLMKKRRIHPIVHSGYYVRLLNDTKDLNVSNLNSYGFGQEFLTGFTFGADIDIKFSSKISLRFEWDQMTPLNSLNNYYQDVVVEYENNENISPIFINPIYTSSIYGISLGYKF